MVIYEWVANFFIASLSLAAFVTSLIFFPAALDTMFSYGWKIYKGEYGDDKKD
tara:strand:+ start:76 stop:234 length:159 start_codon:yes stop_codon:yes gene_type:complete